MRGGGKAHCFGIRFPLSKMRPQNIGIWYGFGSMLQHSNITAFAPETDAGNKPGRIKKINAAESETLCTGCRKHIGELNNHVGTVSDCPSCSRIFINACRFAPLNEACAHADNCKVGSGNPFCFRNVICMSVMEGIVFGNYSYAVQDKSPFYILIRATKAGTIML